MAGFDATPSHPRRLIAVGFRFGADESASGQPVSVSGEGLRSLAGSLMQVLRSGAPTPEQAMRNHVRLLTAWERAIAYGEIGDAT